MTLNILILGGGNMGGAMAHRWQMAQMGAVHVVETDAARRAVLTTQGITCHAQLVEAPQADIYILAIKPQQFAENTASIKAAMAGATPPPLLISIMAGISLAQLTALGSRVARVMPNLPALIGESMSVICAPTLDAATRQTTTDLFAYIGAVAWVEDEAQLHAVTAISGSGPGYVFAFMEALEQAAIAQGLPDILAKKLVAQTLRGSALLADQSTENTATLRAQVTSKGGTTHAALSILDAANFPQIIAQAVAAAAKHSQSLAQ